MSITCIVSSTLKKCVKEYLLQMELSTKLYYTKAEVPVLGYREVSKSTPPKSYFWKAYIYYCNGYVECVFFLVCT